MKNISYLLRKGKLPILNTFLILFGSIWLIIESTSFFLSSFETLLNPYKYLIFIVSIVSSSLISIINHWPKRRIERIYAGSNFKIIVEVKDMFTTNGNIALTSSNYFDTTTDIAANRSLKSQLINRFYSNNVNDLDDQISESLRLQNKRGNYNPAKYDGKKYKYEFGDTATVPFANKKAFIVVLTEVGYQNNIKYTKTSYENLNQGLIPFWKIVRAKGRMEKITVPVFCSGLSSLSLSHLILMQTIILSFAVESKSTRVSPELTIAVSMNNYNPEEFKTIKQFMKSISI